MPLNTTLIFALLPLVFLLVGFALNLISQTFFKRRISFIDWLPLPFLLSAIVLSYPVFHKAGWYFCLALCIWGIIWSLTRFYYDHALYLRKFLRSWWRFVFIMSAAWYLSFLIITII